jgi:tetratricopeptide (TPR) repeat protein
VLLSGEPGIGKSRLLVEFEKLLAAEDHEPMRYFCSALHRTSALYPILARWEHEGDFAPDDPAEVRLRKVEDSVWREKPLPEDALVLGAMMGIRLRQDDQLLKLSPRQRRALTFAALHRRLESAARKRPVLMVLEDAHWADRLTLELFDELVGRIVDLPVLLVVTFRPEFVPPWSGHPGVRQVSLSRLDREEAARVVASVSARRTLSAAVAAQIVERTDGVPLFIEEMTAAVLESAPGPDATQQIAVPTSLRASIMERLDRMPVAKQVAQLGAVAGRRFPVRLVRLAGDLPEADVEAGILGLVAAGLAFRGNQSGDETCTFKHALVQEVAYDSLLRDRRRIIHRRMAEALRDAFTEGAAEQPEVVAHHFARAGEPGEAIEWWEAAGSLAQDRGAFADAAKHLEAALALVSDLPAGDARQRVGIRLQLAYGYILRIDRGFSMPETRAAFAAARDMAAADRDVTGRFQACYGIWSGSFISGDVAAMRQTAAQCLWDTQSMPGTAESAIALRLAGMTHWFQGRFADARRYLERALLPMSSEGTREEAGRFGQDPACTAMVYLAMSSWPIGEMDRASALFEQACRRADALEHFPTVAYVRLHRATYEMFLRNVSRTAEHLDPVLDRVREHGMAVWVVFGRFAETWLAWHTGDRRAACSDMRQSLAEMRAAQGQEVYVPMLTALAGETEALSGHPDTGLLMVEDAIRAAKRSGQLWCLSELHRVRGELLGMARIANASDVEAAFLKAVATARRQGARRFEVQSAMALDRVRAGAATPARADLVRDGAQINRRL